MTEEEHRKTGHANFFFLLYVDYLRTRHNRTVVAFANLGSAVLGRIAIVAHAYVRLVAERLGTVLAFAGDGAGGTLVAVATGAFLRDGRSDRQEQRDDGVSGNPHGASPFDREPR